MTTQITKKQVKEIALEVSKRWVFKNYGSYYNCIDTKTGQQSIQGGDYNFSDYYFRNEVERLYLSFIGENSLYFDWYTSGVKEAEARWSYVYKIKMEVIRLLCGFSVNLKQAA